MVGGLVSRWVKEGNGWRAGQLMDEGREWLEGWSVMVGGLVMMKEGMVGGLVSQWMKEGNGWRAGQSMDEGREWLEGWSVNG